METVSDFIFRAPKSMQMVTVAMKWAAVILSAIIASASLTACGENKKSTDTSSITESSSAPAEKPSREKLKQLIAGDWGRLGEVMHTFYNDNACIIGGMFGTYQISSDCSLIMITEGGTRTEYVWNDYTQTNYWYLDDTTLIVNGSQFSRITEETPDNAE